MAHHNCGLKFTRKFKSSEMVVNCTFDLKFGHKKCQRTEKKHSKLKLHLD